MHRLWRRQMIEKLRPKGMKRKVSLAIAAVVAIAAIVLPVGDLGGGGHGAIAQIISADGVSDRVYQAVPDLPRENQYISKETGQVAEGNTLVARMIRYHLYVKGRPPFYRLDWKLTLADYLGVNGFLNDSDYPSREQLNQNPLKGDVTAVQQLTLAQRNALVQALTDAFSSQMRRSPIPVPKPRVDLPKGTR